MEGLGGVAATATSVKGIHRPDPRVHPPPSVAHLQDISWGVFVPPNIPSRAVRKRVLDEVHEDCIRPDLGLEFRFVIIGASSYVEVTHRGDTLALVMLACGPSIRELGVRPAMKADYSQLRALEAQRKPVIFENGLVRYEARYTTEPFRHGVDTKPSTDEVAIGFCFGATGKDGRREQDAHEPIVQLLQDPATILTGSAAVEGDEAFAAGQSIHHYPNNGSTYIEDWRLSVRFRV